MKQKTSPNWQKLIMEYAETEILIFSSSSAWEKPNAFIYIGAKFILFQSKMFDTRPTTKKTSEDEIIKYA